MIQLRLLVLHQRRDQFNMADRIGKPVTQRQLRVGEMIKQSLSMIFLRNEAKVPNLETNTITVTEVRMSPDLKIAKAYVLPLGGKNAEKTINILKDYSFLIRKILSQKLTIKFLPKIQDLIIKSNFARANVVKDAI